MEAQKARDAGRRRVTGIDQNQGGNKYIHKILFQWPSPEKVIYKEFLSEDFEIEGVEFPGYLI